MIHDYDHESCILNARQLVTYLNHGKTDAMLRSTNEQENAWNTCIRPGISASIKNYKQRSHLRMSSVKRPEGQIQSST